MFYVADDIGISLIIDLWFPHLRKRVEPFYIKPKLVVVVWLDQRDQRD